jgi:biopolymer transport protein TolR
MNTQELGTSTELKNDINVTPLVDVMLVMLIIFMIVTPLLQKGVGVSLPKAANVHPVSEDQNEIILLTMTADGRAYLGADEVDRGSIDKSLHAVYAANPGRQLQIKGDQNLPFREVKRVIRAAREAGFPEAALVAEELKDKDAPVAEK